MHTYNKCSFKYSQPNDLVCNRLPLSSFRGDAPADMPRLNLATKLLLFKLAVCVLGPMGSIGWLFLNFRLNVIVADFNMPIANVFEFFYCSKFCHFNLKGVFHLDSTHFQLKYSTLTTILMSIINLKSVQYLSNVLLNTRIAASYSRDLNEIWRSVLYSVLYFKPRWSFINHQNLG